MANWRRLLVPPLQGALRAAGGWGTPGPGTGRPASVPLPEFTGLLRVRIRPGEGTNTGLVSSGGVATVSVGPDGMSTWYVTYAAISTTTGAADNSTARYTVGPIGSGIVPGGQSYAGGGDSIGLGGQVLVRGDYITVIWSGGVPGDTATLTLYGEQDVLV